MCFGVHVKLFTDLQGLTIIIFLLMGSSPLTAELLVWNESWVWALSPVSLINSYIKHKWINDWRHMWNELVFYRELRLYERSWEEGGEGRGQILCRGLVGGIKALFFASSAFQRKPHSNPVAFMVCCISMWTRDFDWIILLEEHCANVASQIIISCFWLCGRQDGINAAFLLTECIAGYEI